MSTRIRTALFAGLILALVLAACSTPLPTPARGGPASNTQPAPTSSTGGASTLAAPENPLAPETNPVGDIPDSQVFVSYEASPGGYLLDVPEGWARSVNGSDVSFVDKFDGVSVTLKPAASAPTAESAAQNEVAALAQTQRAFQVGRVTDITLPEGQAVRITATANSDPDAVTGKQIRLEEEIYVFYRNGTEASFQLWAPQGADNVDQWKRMSESFRWK